MKEKKERFDEQNNDNKMSKEDDNVSDEQKDKESDAKQVEEKEVKTREDKKDENNMRSPMRSPSNIDDAIKPEWREIVQSAVQAFLEIEDCDIYTPSPIKKTQEPVRPSIPSFSLMIHEENKIGKNR
ncbi:uncharacterized protein LOC110270237 [Arachis ipaensis]|nr:uncharacterized protein LOC110270237 [Arachis ipaensis]